MIKFSTHKAAEAKPRKGISIIVEFPVMRVNVQSDIHSKRSATGKQPKPKGVMVLESDRERVEDINPR